MFFLLLPTPSLPFSAAVCTGLSFDVYETDVYLALCQDMVFSEFPIKRKVRLQKDCAWILPYSITFQLVL